MKIDEITYINVEITQFDQEDDRIDYYMDMGGSPVHWCNRYKQDCTTLWVFGKETYTVHGTIHFDIAHPEQSILSFLAVLLIQ